MRAAGKPVYEPQCAIICQYVVLVQTGLHLSQDDGNVPPA